jgi:hypothetical protein
LQHHTNLNYNSATPTIINLGHLAIKHHFLHRYIILLKAPKTRTTCQQSMDHTCNMIQMIETMKGIFWSFKLHGDASIATYAFADMDRLTDFNDMVDHPVLLVPQKIPADEDAILPYFPNLVEVVPGEFNATPFIMEQNIPFQYPKRHVLQFPNSISEVSIRTIQ